MNEASYWHPDDKHWMAERKVEWRNIRITLDLLAKNKSIKREHIKLHQELFFFGTLNPLGRQRDPWGGEDYYAITGHAAFRYALPFYRLWYHPQPGLFDVGALRQQYMRIHPLSRLSGTLLSVAGAGGLRSVEYGAMGGREARALALCIPSMDYRDTYTLSQGNVEPLCPPPNKMFVECLYGAYQELYPDGRWFPNNVGTLLWDHMAFAIEHYSDYLDDAHDIWRGELLHLLAELLGFHARTDLSRRRPTTIAFVEGLLTRYERRDFPERLLAMWDEAKQHAKRLQDDNKKHKQYWATEEQIQLSDRMSPEKQRARMAQWKLV